jgi:MYXO-CTERM domain-containing protein
MLRSPFPLLVSALAFAAAFQAPATARATIRAGGECEVNSDCGQGFECEALPRDWSGTGGTGAMTGAGGTAAMGAGEADAAAGTGTGGSGSGVPVPPNVCGNGLCDPGETSASCAADCEDYNYCVPAECTSASDCAEGYACPEAILPGTGGASSAPFCGDGLCTGSNENVDTCPADCVGTRYCTPESGYCTSDAQCAPGFYCSSVGTGSGTGGTGAASGGAPGTGGAGMADPGDRFAPAGASGTGAGGTASAGTGSAGTAMGGEAGEPAEVPGIGGTSGIIAAGTCMPREMSGTGGSVGTGGSIGMGGDPTPGGTGSGGAETGGSGPSAGTGQGGTGSEPPPTGAGGSSNMGSGAQSSGGAPSGSTGGTRAASDEDDGDGETVVTHGGCSVARTDGASSFGAFALLALGLARFARRRRVAS